VSSNPYPLVSERATADSGTGRFTPDQPFARSLATPGAPIAVDSLLDTATASALAGPSATAAGPTVRSVLWREAHLSRMLLLADVLALALAFTCAQAISQQGPWKLGWVSLAALVVILLGAKSSGLHDRDEGLLRKAALEEAPDIFQLATMCVLVAWLTADLLDRRTPHPDSVVELWLALSLLLIATRTTARSVERRLCPTERCIFIGDEKSERSFCSKLSNHVGIDAAVVARIGLQELHDLRLGGDFENTVAEIRHLARALEVSRAVVALHGDNPEGTQDLVHFLHAAGMKVSVLPGSFDVLGPSIEFDELDGMTIVDVTRFELSRSSAALKRTFDLTITLMALLAMSPLMLAIAVAIKLDTRGPVFFRQFRVGRHGLRFQMLKFRTMVRDAESLKDSLADRNQALTGLFKINDDPRVTRVGRFLRRTSLDELPQLLNVLRGDMSLVGPRPLILEEDSLLEGWQRRRSELLPGITGPWQILGPVRVSLWEMANIDNRYLLDRSMWADITILLRTMRHIVGRRGL
jgi:exopolysaccharide biosynthesis polyprenyl glycosylphosphotransferase